MNDITAVLVEIISRRAELTEEQLSQAIAALQVEKGLRVLFNDYVNTIKRNATNELQKL